MANPTGTTYLNANANYVWQDGDVYEIQQPDTTEGAAAGASFGGLGVDNQPHQILLNKINYLKAHQTQSTSTVGINGWYKISTIDSSLGTIQIIEQWGIVPAGLVTILGSQGTVSFNFPLAFTKACWSITTSLIGIAGAGISDVPNAYPQAPGSPPAGSVYNLLTNSLFIEGNLGFSQTQWNATIYGIGWRAIGY